MGGQQLQPVRDDARRAPTRWTAAWCPRSWASTTRATPTWSGLALAYHGGAGDFSGIGKTEGSLGTNLYSVHPYARLTFGEAFHVGGSLGIGTGDLSITDKGGAALVETGAGMPVLAALDARLELSLAEAWILALQADGHVVQMVADERLPRFTRVETGTHRLRLGVENSYAFLITDGVSLAPVLETGLRYDGGDAVETGVGFDVGVGLRLDAAVVGLMVDARGHASLNNWGEGQEQAPTLRDWGLGGVIRWRPAGGGMGPEMSLLAGIRRDARRCGPEPECGDRLPHVSVRRGAHPVQRSRVRQRPAELPCRRTLRDRPGNRAECRGDAPAGVC